MGTPPGPVPARLNGEKDSRELSITIAEGIPEKQNYAGAIRAPTFASPNANRQGSLEVKARYSTHNGMPAIIFKGFYYYGIMAQQCKFTIVGKFLRTRPQIEKIRSKFAEKVSIKGSVKIGVYDFRTVFIDCSNEEDFNNVWFRRSIEIEGQVMWLEKWTPDFKPDIDSPIVPVWVLLPILPFHLHTWNYVKQIVGPVGTLSLDSATDYKTRPSMAKVRVEVDLTKTKLNSVWVDLDHESKPSKGYTQKLEYENVPKYYRHCKLLGHSIVECRNAEKKHVGKDKSAGKTQNDGKIVHNQGNVKEGNVETSKAKDSVKNVEEVINKNEQRKNEIGEQSNSEASTSDHEAKNNNKNKDVAKAGKQQSDGTGENNITKEENHEDEGKEKLNQKCSFSSISIQS